MPKVAAGEVRQTAEGYVSRITLVGKERASLLLSACKTFDEATARSKLLASLAQRFRKAGVIGRPEARTLLETAATCSEALLPGVLTVAGELTGGTLPETLAKVPAYRNVGAEWTSGRLHKLHPDHVKAKDSDLDAQRLAHMYEVVVTGGVKLGDKPVNKVTLDDAEIVMRNLPASVKRPATRRAYAHIMHRVLGLAVWPMRLLAVNPLPIKFAPKSGKVPRFPYLYPTEDRQFMACTTVPLAYRVVFGFLAREGCRAGEATAFKVRDFDLRLGVVDLKRNKTDDARSWALDPGVTLALRAWVKLRGAQPDDFMFVDDGGGILTETHKLAERLRAWLWKAEVRRAELHNDSANSRKLRVHDLRATFATLALGIDKSERWVKDRTGWTSSTMLEKYRRAARSAAELNLGWLAPLDQAIPELAEVDVSADYPGIAPEFQVAACAVGGGTGIRSRP